MLEKKITIAIPTYNRKNELQSTLTALSKQTNDFFNIIILNNHSNYDVSEVVASFSDSFKSKCKLINRNVNVGQDINIVECFALCETKWLWVISDDDVIDSNAIDCIYRTIDEVGYFGCINFTICDDMPVETNGFVKLDSIEAFNEFYEEAYRQQSKWHGDLLLLSNKIYDFEIIQEQLITMFKHVYTCIATVVLISKVLEQHIPYVIAKKKIVEYGESTARGWNFFYVVLGSRTFSDIHFNISVYEYKRLLKNVAFNLWTIFYADFSSAETVPANYYDLLYYDLYSICLDTKQRLLFKAIAIMNRKTITRGILERIMKRIMKVE